MDKNELEIVSEFFCGFTCLQLAENRKDDSEQLTTSFLPEKTAKLKTMLALSAALMILRLCVSLT